MTKAAAVETKFEQVREIPLEQLTASRANPRQTMDEAGLKELAASIKEIGVSNPLLVRPDPGYTPADDIYEIICGHRRSEAATLAGLTSVPCIVRHLDDAAAAEIALIDNLQRVDVPAIEEAEAFGALLERLGSIAAVAAKVGKEQGYVAKRLKLLTLTLPCSDALRAGLITIDHALLLARLGEDEQNAALKWCLDHSAGAKTTVESVIAARIEARKPDAFADAGDDPEEAQSRPRFRFTWEPQSVQRLKDHIETESGIPLDRAPWPMDEDYLLPDVGSCLDCEKNTRANAPLFGDLDTGVAVCTDGGCFQAKVEGFVHIQQAAEQKATATRLGVFLEHTDAKVVRASWKATSKPPRMESGEPCDGPVGLNNFTRVPSLRFVLLDGQWVEAKKKCPHTRSAITVDWSDVNNRGYMGGGDKLRKPGEIVQVCITPKCKAHPKAYEQSSAAVADRESEAERKAKAQREMEKFNAFVAAEKPVRRALYDQILAAIKPETIKRNALLELLSYRAQSAICWADGVESDNFEKGRKHAIERIKQAPADELDSLLFHATFGALLVIDGNMARAKDRGRANLRELAKVVGVDAAAIERTHDQPAKADPKPAAKKAAAKPAKKMVLNAAAKKRIADAQKKRWAAAKKKAGRK